MNDREKVRVNETWASGSPLALQLSVIQEDQDTIVQWLAALATASLTHSSHSTSTVVWFSINAMQPPETGFFASPNDWLTACPLSWSGDVASEIFCWCIDARSAVARPDDILEKSLKITWPFKRCEWRECGIWMRRKGRGREFRLAAHYTRAAECSQHQYWIPGEHINRRTKGWKSVQSPQRNWETKSSSINHLNPCFQECERWRDDRRRWTKTSQHHSNSN